MYLELSPALVAVLHVDGACSRAQWAAQTVRALARGLHAPGEGAHTSASGELVLYAHMLVANQACLARALCGGMLDASVRTGLRARLHVADVDQLLADGPDADDGGEAERVTCGSVLRVPLAADADASATPLVMRALALAARARGALDTGAEVMVCAAVWAALDARAVSAARASRDGGWAPEDGQGAARQLLVWCAYVERHAFTVERYHATAAQLVEGSGCSDVGLCALENGLVSAQLSGDDGALGRLEVLLVACTGHRAQAVASAARRLLGVLRDCTSWQLESALPVTVCKVGDRLTVRLPADSRSADGIRAARVRRSQQDDRNSRSSSASSACSSSSSFSSEDDGDGDGDGDGDDDGLHAEARPAARSLAPRGAWRLSLIHI